MKRTIIVIVIALSLGACQHKTLWQHPQGGGFFDRDSYTCQRENIGFYGGGYVDAYGGVWNHGPRVNTGLYQSCMKAKGYYITNKG
jgi:hypothetical protein